MCPRVLTDNPCLLVTYKYFTPKTILSVRLDNFNTILIVRVVHFQYNRDCSFRAFLLQSNKVSFQGLKHIGSSCSSFPLLKVALSTAWPKDSHLVASSSASHILMHEVSPRLCVHRGIWQHPAPPSWSHHCSFRTEVTLDVAKVSQFSSHNVVHNPDVVIATMFLIYLLAISG